MDYFVKHMMEEFEGVLNSRMKVYIDPAFANGETPTEESLKVGYKAWVRNQENIDKMRAFLATQDRETLSDNPKDSYSKAGFDSWTEEIARWDAGDHSDGSAGFFYCPYIPEGLKEGKPFKVKSKAKAMCGCGFVHDSNERCGPW